MKHWVPCYLLSPKVTAKSEINSLDEITLVNQNLQYQCSFHVYVVSNVKTSWVARYDAKTLLISLLNVLFTDLFVQTIPTKHPLYT